MKAKRKAATKAKPAAVNHTAVKPRGTGHLEFDVESISRLAGAVWLIGQLLLENNEDYTDLGPSLKQLAEEIQRYTKLVENGLLALPA